MGLWCAGLWCLSPWQASPMKRIHSKMWEAMLTRVPARNAWHSEREAICVANRVSRRYEALTEATDGNTTQTLRPTNAQQNAQPKQMTS